MISWNLASWCCFHSDGPWMDRRSRVCPLVHWRGMSTTRTTRLSVLVAEKQWRTSRIQWVLALSPVWNQVETLRQAKRAVGSEIARYSYISRLFNSSIRDVRSCWVVVALVYRLLRLLLASMSEWCVLWLCSIYKYKDPNIIINFIMDEGSRRCERSALLKPRWNRLKLRLG